MFTLTTLKRVIYWLSGLAALSFLWRLVEVYLRERAVRNSSIQGDKDGQALTQKVESAEKRWQADGQEVDRKLDST